MMLQGLVCIALKIADICRISLHMAQTNFLFLQYHLIVIPSRNLVHKWQCKGEECVINCKCFIAFCDVIFRVSFVHAA